MMPKSCLTIWRGCIARAWQIFSILGNLCDDPCCFVYGGVALHLRVELETKVKRRFAEKASTFELCVGIPISRLLTMGQCLFSIVS